MNTPSSSCKAHIFMSNFIKYGKKKYFRVPTEEIPLSLLIIHSSYKCYWAKTSVDIIHVLKQTPREKKKQNVDDLKKYYFVTDKKPEALRSKQALKVIIWEVKKMSWREMSLVQKKTFYWIYLGLVQEKYAIKGFEEAMGCGRLKT